MIAAELRIKHTRKWCSQEDQESPDSLLEFSYDIFANPESWLVGGRKRGNFTAVEGETKTFSIMLVPQKPGCLLLPALEIRAFVQPQVGSGSKSASAVPATMTNHGHNTSPNNSISVAGGEVAAAHLQRKQISCEVDYRNLGQTLLVLPDLRKTTVSLSSSSSGGGGGSSWLVDSETIQSQSG